MWRAPGRESADGSRTPAQEGVVVDALGARAVWRFISEGIYFVLSSDLAMAGRRCGEHFMLSIYAQSEFETIKRDAYNSEGATPQQRTNMFIGLMEMVDAIQANLTTEERLRRQRIADRIDPRPDPWWRNFRQEALEAYACKTSST
jgi:hypothetical protein